MFKGTDPAVLVVYGAACREGRRLGHNVVGTEHLLHALASRPTATGHTLRAHGLSPAVITTALDELRGVSAAVAADCRAAQALGIDLAGLLGDDTLSASLLPARPTHRVLPLGWRKGRQWCTRVSPPIGGDAEAAYEAALYLALAYWHRQMTEAHLAQVVLRWSRGSVFVAESVGADRPAALAALDAAAPPRRRLRGGHVRRAEALAA